MCDWFKNGMNESLSVLQAEFDELGTYERLNLLQVNRRIELAKEIARRKERLAEQKTNN